MEDFDRLADRWAFVEGMLVTHRMVRPKGGVDADGNGMVSLCGLLRLKESSPKRWRNWAMPRRCMKCQNKLNDDRKERKWEARKKAELDRRAAKLARRKASQ